MRVIVFETMRKMLYLYELSYTVHSESVDIDELIEELNNQGLQDCSTVDDQQTLIQISSKYQINDVVEIIKRSFKELTSDDAEITFHLTKVRRYLVANYEFVDGSWFRL